MRASRATQFDRAAALAEAAQLHAHGGGTFFQSPAFLRAWLEAAGEGVRLLRVEENNAPVALAFVSASRGGISGRAARFGETGRPEFDRLYVEYQDFLLESPSKKTHAKPNYSVTPERSPRVRPLAGPRINAAEHPGSVSRNSPSSALEVQEMDPGSPLAPGVTASNTENDFRAAAVRDAALDALVDGAPEASEFVFRNTRPAMTEACARAAARRGLEMRVLLTQPTFAVDLAERETALSSSLRTKIRRSLKRYEERGPVRLTPAATADERASAFEELIALHEPYWKSRGEPGAFADPELRSFHERFIAAAPESVDLLRLTAGEETFGVLYNFIAGGRAYNYQSGLKAESDNQFAPGFTGHSLAIAHYRAKGFSAYDLMAGEADYKRRLAREGETLTSLVIERRSVLQRAKSLARRFRCAGTRQT
jgi:CelD/BcsL family acetyltransferase involved in cellulose biosynthesis